MLTNTDLQRRATIDLSDVFSISNALHTPFLSLLLAKGLDTKAVDVLVSRKVKTYNSDFSGGKVEGGKITDYQKTGYTYVSNVCEIFSKAVSVSNTAIAVNGDGKTLLAKELQDRVDELKFDIENQILNGTKDDGNVSGIRKMDGIVKLAGKAIDAKGTKLDFATLNSAFKELYKNKATKDVHIFVSPEDKILIDELVVKKEQHIVQLTAGATTVGLNVEQFWTSYGFTVKVCVEPNLQTGSLIIVDLDKVELPTLRPVTMQNLSTVGDSVEAFIVGELTLIASNQHVVTIKNFLNA